MFDMWSGIFEIFTKLGRDRRLAATVILTAVVWLGFEILGSPNPLNTQRTFALFVIMAVICIAADAVWGWIFRRPGPSKE